MLPHFPEGFNKNNIDDFPFTIEAINQLLINKINRENIWGDEKNFYEINDLVRLNPKRYTDVFNNTVTFQLLNENNEYLNYFIEHQSTMQDFTYFSITSEIYSKNNNNEYEHTSSITMITTRIQENTVHHKFVIYSEFYYYEPVFDKNVIDRYIFTYCKSTLTNKLTCFYKKVLVTEY